MDAHVRRPAGVISIVTDLAEPSVHKLTHPLVPPTNITYARDRQAKTREPLLIVAEECKDEALQLLVVNKLRGLVDVCSVRAPFAGQRRSQFLQDIALATGATLIDSELGMMLQTVTPDMLGYAESATTTRYVYAHA